jgi:tetratricopeptide (TPR) repeat protein
LFLPLSSQANDSVTNSVANSNPPAGSSARFDLANRHYEEGRYARAATAYQELLATGTASAPIHFNLANSLYKSGEIGRAIAHYRAALWLSPRDPDIHANLRFIRTQLPNSVPHPQDSRWLHRLTLNEWTLAASASLWLASLLAIPAVLTPAWRRRLRPWNITSVLILAATTACLTLAASHELSPLRVVVVTPQAVVRNGPLDQSKQFYSVSDGTELIPGNTKGHWRQVTDASDRTGWIQSDSVLFLTSSPLTSTNNTSIRPSASAPTS